MTPPCQVVGITEHMDETMVLIAHALGIPHKELNYKNQKVDSQALIDAA